MYNTYIHTIYTYNIYIQYIHTIYSIYIQYTQTETDSVYLYTQTETDSAYRIVYLVVYVYCKSCIRILYTPRYPTSSRSSAEDPVQTLYIQATSGKHQHDRCGRVCSEGLVACAPRPPAGRTRVSGACVSRSAWRGGPRCDSPASGRGSGGGARCGRSAIGCVPPPRACAKLNGLPARPPSRRAILVGEGPARSVFGRRDGLSEGGVFV